MLEHLVAGRCQGASSGGLGLAPAQTAATATAALEPSGFVP